MNALPVEIYPLIMQYMVEDLSPFALLNKSYFNVFSEYKDQAVTEYVKGYLNLTGSIDYKTYRLIVAKYPFLLRPVTMQYEIWCTIFIEFDELEYPVNFDEDVDIQELLNILITKRGDSSMLSFLDKMVDFPDDVKCNKYPLPTPCVKVTKSQEILEEYLLIPYITSDFVLTNYLIMVIRSLINMDTLVFEYFFNLLVQGEMHTRSNMDVILYNVIIYSNVTILYSIVKVLVQNSIYPTSGEDAYYSIIEAASNDCNFYMIKQFIKFLKRYKIDLYHITGSLIMHVNSDNRVDILKYTLKLMNGIGLFADDKVLDNIGFIARHLGFATDINVLKCNIKAIKEYANPALHAACFKEIRNVLFASNNYNKKFIKYLNRLLI